MTTGGTSFLDNLRYPIRQFNKWILNPATLPFAGRRWGLYAVVRHVGRRSGRSYATPVVAAATEEGFVIPLPYGENIDWLRNVLAAGGCNIDWKGKSCEVTEPQVIDSSAALPSFPSHQQLSFRLFRIRKFLSLKRLSTPSEDPEG